MPAFARVGARWRAPPGSSATLLPACSTAGMRSDQVQAGGLLFLIIQLNEEASAVKRIQTGLRVAAIDGNAPHRRVAADVFRIGGQNLLVIFPGLA